MRRLGRLRTRQVASAKVRCGGKCGGVPTNRTITRERCGPHRGVARAGETPPRVGFLRGVIRVLFVTPSELSSGEAVTALHMAERVVRRGGRCAVLASPFTAALLESRLGSLVTRLTSDRKGNQALWDIALRDLRPDAVVFADYPLLFFSNGITPLADDGWVASLENIDALPITLDHLGYAQRVMR